jgi:hypothetical protein
MEVIANARVMSDGELLALRVDRDSEVGTCTELLMSTRGNVFIFGPRGIGKTFLVRLVHSKLRERGPEVFPFFLNATELAMFGAKGTGEVFPAMLLLQLISSIWRGLLRHPYSKLLESVERHKRAIKIENAVLGRLERLFIQLRYPKFSTTQENINEFSVSAIAKGGLKENLTTERKSVGILPYEFIEYLEELKTDIFPKVGISKCIGIIDEANMMPVEWQEAVVSRHIDIFSNRGMQFILVAGIVPPFSTVDVARNFEFVLELKGLPLVEIPRLLDVHFGEQAKRFSEDSIELLHKETEGNPREVVILAERTLLRSEAKNAPIGTCLIMSVAQEYRDLMERLRGPHILHRKARGRASRGR